MKIIFLLLISLFLYGCAATEPATAPIKPAARMAVENPFHEIKTINLTDAREIKAGQINRFTFTNWGGAQIPVWFYIPAGVNVASAPILFMLHGAKRDPHRYLREWVEPANQHGLIIIAPEFSLKTYPDSGEYTRGNIYHKQTMQIQEESVWTFSVIEPLFDTVRTKIGSNKNNYSIYGHSAGSQFTHRFLYFKQNTRAKRFIAANAGWYTLPDYSEPFPHGLGNTPVTESHLKSALTKDVIVLLGDADNDPNHESLSRSAGSMRQGPHRFARGQYFFENAKKQAQKYGVRLGWRMQVVPGATHDNHLMAAAVAPLID